MISEFNKICECLENVDMEKYNTYRLVNHAKIMVFPSNVDELKKVVKLINKLNLKFFVIGNGSNIILPNYYDGVIINLSKFNKYEIKDNTLYVDAGVMLNKVASEVSNMGYRGLDFATGIPGTIGGSIHGNAGCYGSSISEVLISVTVLDKDKIREIKNKDLKFDYRYSIFKEKTDLIILSAKFRLEEANIKELKDLIKERTEKRVASQDLSHPSNGSVFRNPEGFAAGKLIDDLGLKGYSIGDAMISNKHANFIINNGKATTDDIIKLINKIKKDVKDHYDIELKLEQEIIE